MAEHDPVHYPLFMSQPYGGPTLCGLDDGAWTGAGAADFGQIQDKERRSCAVSCPACLSERERRDAAWRARRRAEYEAAEATAQIAEALFGWLG